MFTGIIEEIGRVNSASMTKDGICLSIDTGDIASGAKIGDSISVNGACLTITRIENNRLTFDVMNETLARTNLGGLKTNDRVNLERSLKVDSRIDGHFVCGHVDYKGKVVGLLKDAGGAGLKISMPPGLSAFVVEKGSVAVDGVSLTVAKVGKEDFTVYLIPHTLKITTLGTTKKGDSVNIETDLLAKYIAGQAKKPDLTALLKKYDYI